MGQHTAVIAWHRQGAAFVDNRYSRGHRWTFDGGVDVPASASPHVVPAPMSVAAAVDPEEAFVASLASCHMLWFLHIAAKQGFVVESYRDQAVGVLAKDAEGKLAMTEVALQPVVAFGGDRRPSPAEHQSLHHAAHQECFIANSVKTTVRCSPHEEAS
ncbi:MAG TPA: OsmC family protein [Vicinamibacteria bacterium]|nr:OsmC family protein [Vicinamibacteria bacterium]